VAIQPTFLLIADIAGYTRFMKFHQASLAHAQDIVAQLLEAVIDATQPHLKLAKLEGDAAFFYIAYPPDAEPSLDFVAEQCARSTAPFIERPRSQDQHALRVRRLPAGGQPQDQARRPLR
jgi:class 3 adenylate cyclase